MKTNNIWPEKNEKYYLDDGIKYRLVNDDYKIEQAHLNVGVGAIISFKKNLNFKNEFQTAENIMIYDFPEQEGYDSLVKTYTEIENNTSIYHINNDHIVEKLVDNAETDFEKSVAENDRNELISTGKEEVKTELVNSNENNQNDSFDSHEKDTVDSIVISGDSNEKLNNELKTSSGTVLVETLSKKETRNINTIHTEDRIRMGISKSKDDIYWEYGNEKLSNRHLLIGGKSGEGKTYFIQSLLLQLSRLSISSLIVDYSNSFAKKQLEDCFLDQVGEKFNERIVKIEKFPINPFKKRKDDLGNDENNYEVAERISGIFAAVLRGMGDQQRNSIIEATINGLEKYGESMKFKHLIEELDEIGAKTTSSKLTFFKYSDPFEYDKENDWSTIFDGTGKVTVIQLAGFSDDYVQRLLTEFILWDIWSYSQKGNQIYPIPVILDESQNLDFSNSGPINKILREGRKFGWSAWLATQTFSNFTKEQFAVLDNVASKIYFRPAESEITTISKLIAGKDSLEIESQLRSLTKGHALVNMNLINPVSNKLGNLQQLIITVPKMK